MKKTIRNGLLGLMALTSVACSTLPTNTQSLRNAPVRYSSATYQTHLVNFDGNNYFVIAVPQGKDIAYKGTRIPESASLDFYAIPESNHTTLTRNGKTTVSSEELYGFVNLGKDSNNLVINTNELKKTPWAISREDLTVKLRTSGMVVAKKRKKESSLEKGVEIMGTSYHPFNIQGSTNLTFDSEGFALMPISSAETYIFEKESNKKSYVEAGLNGVQYGMVPITLVDEPKKSIQTNKAPVVLKKKPVKTTIQPLN